MAHKNRFKLEYGFICRDVIGLQNRATNKHVLIVIDSHSRFYLAHIYTHSIIMSLGLTLKPLQLSVFRASARTTTAQMHKPTGFA